VNARVRSRRILFDVFALKWIIMKPILVKSLLYIVAHHMFEKNTKRVLFLFL